jgi:hypothetical protein
MTNLIQIPASISKACESSALSPVEACEASQVVEGQGAQTMAFRIVEQPRQFLRRRLDSLAIEWLSGGGASFVLRHASPDGTGFLKTNAAANVHGAV